MTEFYEQYKSIKPWLENTKKPKKKTDNPQKKERNLTDFMNAFCAPVALHHVQVTGGTVTNFWGQLYFFKHIVLLSIAGIKTKRKD